MQSFLAFYTNNLAFKTPYPVTLVPKPPSKWKEHKMYLKGKRRSDTASSALNVTKKSRQAGAFTLSSPACFLVMIFGPSFSWWKWNSRPQLVFVHRTQTNCPKCTSLLSQNSISSWSHSYSSQISEMNDGLTCLAMLGQTKSDQTRQLVLPLPSSSMLLTIV